jgi:hypothetical protein
LLVAELALVPRRAHLLLVAEPLQVLRRDVHPRRFRRGRWWMRWFGVHEAIVSVLGGKFRPPVRFGRSRHLGGRPICIGPPNAGTYRSGESVVDSTFDAETNRGRSVTMTKGCARCSRRRRHAGWRRHPFGRLVETPWPSYRRAYAVLVRVNTLGGEPSQDSRRGQALGAVSRRGE